jgi:hypothetical protein
LQYPSIHQLIIVKAMTKYFVSKRTFATDPFQIVFREVKTRTHKGYPITYELKTLAGEYATWEEALAIAEKLNADCYPGAETSGINPSWPW